jgi:hypothetical protein
VKVEEVKPPAKSIEKFSTVKSDEFKKSLGGGVKYKGAPLVVKHENQVNITE